jgi:hypothetical protein
MKMKLMSLMFLTLAFQAMGDTPIQITVPAGGVLEQLFDGRFVMFSCSPTVPVFPNQHWVCNEAVAATTADGANLTIPAQGEGSSKFDAYNALINDCNNRAAQYNASQGFVLNKINSDNCGSLTPTDSALNCTQM